MERNKAAQVQVHVVAMPHLLQCSNHREAHPIKKNRCPDRGTPREQRAPHLVPNHYYGPFLGVIEFIEPASFINGKVPNLIEVGGHARDLTAGLVKVADRPY